MPPAPHRALPDRRASLIPPEILPLFDDAFVRSCDLLEEYVARLALKRSASAGLERACADGATVDEAIERAGSTRPSRACRWRGCSRRSPRAAGSSTVPRRAVSDRRAPLPAGSGRDPAAQAANDERCLPSYRIAALAAERYPAVLRGELTGEQALFGPKGVVAWSKYFSNANPLYASRTRSALSRRRGPCPPGRGGARARRRLRQRCRGAARADRGAGRANEIAVPGHRDSAMFLRRAERTLRARFRGRRSSSHARHRPAVCRGRCAPRELRARLRRQRPARRARPGSDARGGAGGARRPGRAGDRGVRAAVRRAGRSTSSSSSTCWARSATRCSRRPGARMAAS